MQQHTQAEIFAMMQMYFIPLAICLLHSWVYQMQKTRDSWNDGAKEFGIVGFIPIINIIASVVLSVRTLFQLLYFIISFPSMFKKKL